MAISEDTQTYPGILSQLSPVDRAALLGMIRGEIEAVLESGPHLQRTTGGLVRSEAVSETLDQLVDLTGHDPEDLLLRALTLYEVAYEAVTHKNQRLVLVSHEYDFVREIVGLGEQPTESQAADAKAV